MDFNVAAKYIDFGYRVKRSSWDKDYLDRYNVYSLEDVLADDWELVLENIVSYFPVEYLDE